MDGLLIIDKPPGWTSHDVVARVRRLSGVRRVGHAGTLDPMATGVLPLGLGRATRVLEYLSDAGKVYQATVRLGISTDTDDAEGVVIAERDPSALTEGQVRDALATFGGEIEQMPPVYSAIKQGGVSLHRLARAGRAVQVQPRRVRIDRIEVLAVALPEVTFVIECSKGTYVRSLARDLGERLGVGGHLTALRRLRSGPFTLAAAHTVEQLAATAADGKLATLLLPADAGIIAMVSLTLDSVQAYRVLTGRGIRLAGAPPPNATLARAYSADRVFLAIVRAGDGEWMPAKVFAGPEIVAPPGG